MDYYINNIPVDEREKVLFDLKGYGEVTFKKAFDEIRSKLKKDSDGDWGIENESEISVRILEELNNRGLLKNVNEPPSSFL